MPRTLSRLTHAPDLHRRMLFTLALLAVYRIGCFITTPGVDRQKMATLFGEGQNALDFFNVFSGGALEQMSVFALGILPYISASIIFQLLAAIVPSVRRLQKEGEEGRRRINQYTRYATLGIAIIQGLSMAFLLQNLSDSGEIRGLVTYDSVWGFRLITVLSLTSGAVFIMWLGEQITERGIGNGISLLIFAGIVARLPSALAGVWTQVTSSSSAGDGLSPFDLALIVAIVAATIALICVFERAQRRIPIQHARRKVGARNFGSARSFLPLKINAAGVMPPIFASSIMLFPMTLASYFQDVAWIQDARAALLPGEWTYTFLFVVLVMFFSVFYTALVFDPVDVADNLKRNQASIPGVRPGRQTASYIDRVMTRLTFAGACYLALVCVVPDFMQGEFHLQFYFGGTAWLIMVGVALDTVQQIESRLVTRQYDAIAVPGTRTRD